MDSFDDALDDSLRERVARHISSHARHVVPTEGELVPAAVALALVADDQGRACFLLTRRSRRLRRHAGQFALPGGRIDAGETPAQAALRELSEEVGVVLPEAQVLGLLDDFETRSGYVITPVVVWGESADRLSPNPDEVAVVYRVPLRDLLRPDVPHVRRTVLGKAPVLSLPLVGTEVFSPTAAIIYQLREVGLFGRDTRVFHYEQPLFAWR